MTLKKEIRKITGTIKAGLKIALAYKFEFAIALVTTPISLFIFYYLWKSIYEFSKVNIIRGYTFPELVTYFVLSMIVSFFVWSDVDQWLEHEIVKGDLVGWLLRPISYIKNEFCFETGLKIISFTIQAIPIAIGAHLVLDLNLTSWIWLLFAIVSVLLASIMIFLISFAIGTTSFWLKRIQGLRRFKRGIILLLSGGLLPLTFFPTWWTNVSHFLPFEYIRYVPINIYLGKYSLTGSGFENVFITLATQLIWVIILFVLCKLLWNLAIKKFAGAGA
ncbi:hypothetical protein HOK51_00810 [Candidatus Woesearchaeota archaeon]|jgi:ABC-2 type transport system permease protein|nr:hypothetical protein [Candidatus Woesearchaeota archaeon]MBT6518355.1 hypothetical protein [Candidatus Woesearchaeota archaeon]MBT7366652.1 hypothetical protein [Candidatus Woesearchaeota archaeon]